VTLEPEFVEFIPENLQDSKIYISETFATAVHKCCCGCGHKVVTPLSPTGWKLTVNRGRVSLYPSIGNWSFPCRSHYWVKSNEIQWSVELTQSEISAVRDYDAMLKESYFNATTLSTDTAGAERHQESMSRVPSLWRRLTKWLFG
jgi:hypothetical protein